MDEKLLILLGLGAIGYLAATNLNEDDEDCYENHNHHTEDGLIYMNQPTSEETYLPNMSNTSPSISYTNYPMIPSNTNVSPLGFGQMVNIKEDYVPSDYINLKEYSDNPDQIPVYDETSGNVGLPVSDMTDMGADNKYIYDRTLGSIGFTSTKIGGRRRGQADYIRGDLPILPDRGAWFQVSPDITNTLLDGALGNQQALGGQAATGNQESSVKENYYQDKKQKGQHRAMRTVELEGGQVIGECDDELANYEDCIYDTFKKKNLQPTMAELKRMFSLQQQTQNSKFSGYTQA